MDSMQQIKMQKVFVFFCMFAASSAVFFPFLNLPKTGQNMMNVCVYSMDPSRYQPKCFLCPSTVYSNVLQACLNAAAIPRNITYTQALCLEQNCAINRGKRSVDVHQPQNLLEEFDGQLPIDDEEENAGDQQNGEQDGDEQKNLLGEFDAQLPIDDEEENAGDQQNGEQDAGEQKNGSLAEQHDGYKVVGTEEFMASDVEDYLDYSDVVD